MSAFDVSMVSPKPEADHTLRLASGVKIAYKTS